MLVDGYIMMIHSTNRIFTSVKSQIYRVAHVFV